MTVLREFLRNVGDTHEVSKEMKELLSDWTFNVNTDSFRWCSRGLRRELDSGGAQHSRAQHSSRDAHTHTHTLKAETQTQRYKTSARYVSVRGDTLLPWNTPTRWDMGNTLQRTFMSWSLPKGKMFSALKKKTFFHLFVDFAGIIS